MRVVQIDLTDWRGFERLKLSFEPDLTVLVGENGAGKSAILDATARALALVLPGLSLVGDAPNHVVRAGAERAVALVTLEEAGEQHAVRLAVGPGSPLTGDPWFLDRFADRPQPVSVLYPADRSAPDLTPGNGVIHGMPVYDLARPDRQERVSGFEPLFEWFKAREDLENEHIRDDPSHRDPGLDAVRAAIKAMWPGVSAPRLRRVDPKSGRPVPTRLSVDKDGDRLFFDALSDGERGLIALGADIARRLVEAADPADPHFGEGIVLIDEIDQHLHPRLQREVADRLRRAFPKVQWVMTTHSPLVAMHVPSRCIRLLEQFRLVDPPNTEGRDANSLLVELFGAPIQPASTEAALRRVARHVDHGDWAGAREELDALAKVLGETDASILRNRTLLDLVGDP